MGRKDLLINKLEMACYAAGFQNAQEIVRLQVRVLEDHFGKSLEDIDAICSPGRKSEPDKSFAIRVRKSSTRKERGNE